MESRTAQARYNSLESERMQFLSVGRAAAALTLPYLLTEEGHTQGATFHTPWQSVGAKGCNVLASKMMLSLFPINTTFFKLQVNDSEVSKMPNMTPETRAAIDLALSKSERVIMQFLAETNDRIMLHTAMKHLVVTGNCLVFAGKEALKTYPLDRFVIARDGNSVVQEIVTKDIVDRMLLPKDFQSIVPEKDANSPGEDGPKEGVTSTNNKGQSDDAVVYTHIKLEGKQHKWYQECDGKRIPGSESSSPISTSPWMPLRFNVVDGESYGRGRVEEFIGDLNSLEMLMKCMVEGSAAAGKVVFLVSPSATTKPQSIARASNGAIIQGRADDVSVVSVAGKTADFQTVQQMIGSLTQRLSDAFLILSVRQSERTTAEEVRATQQELNEQLGGIYGNLTSELLRPYLSRKLSLLTKAKKLPPMPKDLVMPTVVAGLNGVGRGQDKSALIEFVSTVAQSMGPEVMQSFVNPSEFLSRLAAASGIESFGLIKTGEEIAQEKEAAMQEAQQMSVTNQLGQISKSPIAEQVLNGNAEQEQPQAPPSPQA